MLRRAQTLANQRLARTKITPHATPRHAQTRNAGGANSGHTGYGTGPYRGFVFPEPPQWQTVLGHVMLTSTFLWFFWRMKWDGGHLVGHIGPWAHDEHDHHDDHHDDPWANDHGEHKEGGH